MIGTEVIRLDVVDSTNTQLNGRARKGAAEGTVLVASAQTDGRGHRGSVWESPAGENLYCSVLLKPKLTPDEASHLTVMAGIALARYLSETYSLPVSLKWPNDIYCNGKKLGGILCESKIKKKILEFVIVGIGLNVNSGLESFSPGLQKRVTSLFLETGREIDLEQVLKECLPYLNDEYKRFSTSSWADLQRRFNEFV